MVKDSIKFVLSQLVLNLAWCLYLVGVGVVGWLVLYFLNKKYKLNFAKPKFLKENAFYNILLSFAFGVLTLGVLSMPFYLFNWSSWVYTTMVFVLIGLSLVFAVKVYLPRIFEKLKLLKKGVKVTLNYKIIAILVVLAFIAFDFVLAVWNGALYADGSDIYVHYSRVFDIINSGRFTIRDGFLLGVDEVRYAFNFIYALFVPLMSMTSKVGASLIDTGFAAHAAFRAIQALAAGALSFSLLSYCAKLKRLQVWIYSLLGVVMTFSFYHFFSANYPNNIVFAWFVLLFIGMTVAYSTKFTKEGLWMLVFIAVLSAGTHPTYALIAAVFLFVVYVLLWLVWLIKNKLWFQPAKLFGFEFWMTVLTCFILISSSLFAYLQPNNLTEASKLIESQNANLNIFGVNVFPPLPELIDNQTAVVSVLSILGTVAFLFLAWNKSWELGLMVSVMTFFVLITSSNPLFVFVMQRLGLPYWLIRRFNALNIIRFYRVYLVFGFVGLFKSVDYINRKLKIKPAVKMAMRCLITGVVVLSVLSIAKVGLGTVKSAVHYGSLNHDAIKIYSLMESQVRPYLKGEDSLILSTQYTSYYLPLISPVKVIYIDSNHTPPTAAALQREQCQNFLLDNLGEGEAVSALGVKYIVLDNFQPDELYSRQVAKLRSLPEFYRELSVGGTYAVFEVVTQQKSPAPVCSEYLEIESE